MQAISTILIGKPNVGKSTLFNKLINENYSEVSQEPGTTINAISKSIIYKNIKINLFDTGGIKKKSKSHNEKQITITKDTIKFLKKSDIVIFLMEANSDFTRNDKQILRLALNKLKDFIIIINKLDLIDGSEIRKLKKYFNHYFENTFSDILINPSYISAKNYKNDNVFFDKIIDIYSSKKKIIKNKELNSFLNYINLQNLPAQKGKFRPTIKFIKHVNTKPQIFKVFGNRLQKLNSDYKKFLTKQLIKKFNLYNQVVIIKYISNKNPYSRSNIA